MTIYNQNYKSLKALFGNDIHNFPEYLRFESEGFMPLTFDRISRTQNAVQYAMTHWYSQNGDLIQDPEMLIEIRRETVEALSITHAPPFNRLIPVYNADRTLYSPRQKKEQNAFLKTWLQNIKDQGFKRVVIDADHPDNDNQNS